jgi:hypothetical protein
MRTNANDIFGDSECTFETLDRDILSRIGDTKVHYGVKVASIDKGVYKLGFGLRKKVVPIKKLLKRIARLQTVKSEEAI